MKINAKNTVVLLYVSLQTQGSVCMQRMLRVSGNTLQQVEKFKHLGVVFASDGRWSEETDTRIGEANVFLDELYRFVVTKREFSNTTKLSVSKSVFLPILTYGPESWQARRQDLAAGGPKTKMRGPKTRRGNHIFKIQYWMYAATGRPNVKRGGTDSKRGGRAPLPPPR